MNPNTVSQGLSRRLCLSVLLAAHLAAGSAGAQSVLARSDETRLGKEFNWLPYGFFSESFVPGVGIGASYGGWPVRATKRWYW